MREIRFRAWHKASRRMFDVNAISKTTVEELRNGVSFRYYRDDVVLMQYTGLKDKYGREIYEGDVVKYGDTIHEVVFEQRNNTAYFGLVYSPEETRSFGHYQDLQQIEIIGNVHDNPELVVTDDA